jgi:hypothetical protein
MQPNDIEWFITRDGRPHGPLTSHELRLFVEHQHLREDDVIYCITSETSPKRINLTAKQISAHVKILGSSNEWALLTEVKTSKHKNHVPVSKLIATLAAEAIEYIRKIYLLTTQTNVFFQKYITINHPRRLKFAMAFFFASFSIAFLILTLASKFEFYSGTSEIRLIIKISLQLAIGTFFLFIFLKLFKSNAPIISVASLVLYFDGLYLIFASGVNLLIAWFKYYYSTVSPSGVLEKDIYATFFESCVCSKSTLYWIIRGDLEFYIGNSSQTNNLYLDNLHLVVAFLCLGVISRGFSTHYKPGKAAFLICSSIVFLVASEGYSYLEDKTTSYLASKHSPCWDEAAETIAKQYRAEAVLPQLMINLRREIAQFPVDSKKFTDFVFPNIYAENASLLVKAAAPSYIITDERGEFFMLVQKFAIATYCNNSSHFRLARALNIPLKWQLHDETGSQQITFTVKLNNCEKS